MKGIIEISDTQFDELIKKSIDSALTNAEIEKLIERKVNERVDKIINKVLSSEKIDNFARDRVSRILTTESLKDYTFSLQANDVLSNLEEKIILMIQNSKDFKTLVKLTIKNSL
jgi:transcriptional regulatory protein LevR